MRGVCTGISPDPLALNLAWRGGSGTVNRTRRKQIARSAAPNRAARNKLPEMTSTWAASLTASPNRGPTTPPPSTHVMSTNCSFVNWDGSFTS